MGGGEEGTEAGMHRPARSLRQAMLGSYWEVEEVVEVVETDDNGLFISVAVIAVVVELIA